MVNTSTVLELNFNSSIPLNAGFKIAITIPMSDFTFVNPQNI